MNEIEHHTKLVAMKEALVRHLIEKGNTAEAFAVTKQIAGSRELLRILTETGNGKDA